MTLEIEKSGQTEAAGGGSDPAFVGGTLSINTTAAATTAVTTEETLMSYTVPANTLLKDGQGIRIKVAATFAATATTKTVRIKLGATTLFTDTGVFNDVAGVYEIDLFRTGVGAQKRYIIRIRGTAAFFNPVSTSSEDETTDLAITVTGQNGTANADDITAELLHAEFINF